MSLLREELTLKSVTFVLVKTAMTGAQLLPGRYNLWLGRPIKVILIVSCLCEGQTDIKAYFEGENFWTETVRHLHDR